MLKDSASAREAARICGFDSVAMLDYLQRSGVFVPSDRIKKRRGKGRRYNFRDLLVLKTIATLLKNGASVAALKMSLREFQEKKWKADRGSLEFDDLPLKYFIISAGVVMFARSQDTIYDLTKSGQMVFNFVIDMDKLHSDLCFDLSQTSLPLVLKISR